MRLEKAKNVNRNMIDDYDDTWHDNTPTRPLDRLRNYEMGEELLLDGFLGDAMGTVYRNGKQHVCFFISDCPT